MGQENSRDASALHGGDLSDANYYCQDGSDNELSGSDVQLMQSVGLKGKTDREIYESDIVRAKSNRTKKIVTGAIQWQMWEAAFRLVVEGDYCYRIDDIHAAKVIGNMYENSELLGS